MYPMYTDSELEQMAQELHGQRITLEGLTGVVVCSNGRIQLHLDDETLNTEAYIENAAAMGADFLIWDFGEADDLVYAAHVQVENSSVDSIEEIIEMASRPPYLLESA